FKHRRASDFVAQDNVFFVELVLQCPDFPERLLQFSDCIFLLGNIQRVADQSRDLSVLDDWLSRAVHNPFSLLRMVNPIRHVDANALAKDSLERFGYKIAIVRMQNGQPFRKCRNAFRWIETEENKRLRRPIVEYAVGPKRPAPHMSQSFPFTQVKFASLEIREWPLRPLWPNVRAVAFHLLLHENWCARRLYQSTLASPVTKLALRQASLGLIVLKGITRLHTGLLIVA